MDRRGLRLFALGWLLLLHSLAGLTVALYRCLELNGPLLDHFAAALTRCQIGLLAAWLVLGKEPLSWRLSGLVGGIALLFSIYSRLLFPGVYRDSLLLTWAPDEFAFYFRPSGPGDLLLKTPVLVLGIALPLGIWRLGSWWAARRRGQLAEPALATGARWMQFRFQDFFVWNVALCLLLSAWYVTPPYDGWLSSIFARWWRSMQMQTFYSQFAVASALPTVTVILVTLWASHSRESLSLRLSLAIIIAALVAIAFDLWWDGASRIQNGSTVYSGRPSECGTAITIGIIAAGSIWLLKLYDRAGADVSQEIADSAISPHPSHLPRGKGIIPSRH